MLHLHTAYYIVYRFLLENTNFRPTLSRLVSTQKTMPLYNNNPILTPTLISQAWCLLAVLKLEPLVKMRAART